MSNKGKIKIEYTGKEKISTRKNPYKNDVLYTEEGQWKYPGQITKIPSGEISMDGVNYPVAGIDNLGNTQMMYPGANYHFPGSSVTEYPQIQTGGSTNINLMKNTFSRKWGGSDAPMNDHYFIPSMGMYPTGGETRDPYMTGTPTSETQLPSMGYEQDPASGQWRYGKDGAYFGYIPGRELINYNQPVTASIATPPVVTPNVNPAIPIKSGSSMGTGYNITQQQPGNTQYKGVRPARSQQNMFQKIKYGVQDLTHKEGGSHFESPDSNRFEDERNSFLTWLKGTSLNALHEEMLPHAQFHHMPDGSIMSDADMDQEEEEYKKGGFKLNPDHAGWCTPMTKSTCTGKRRQFAINAKNHFKKQQFGGTPSMGNADLSYEYMMGGGYEMDIPDYYGTPTEDLKRGGSRKSMNYFNRGNKSMKGAGLSGMNSYCGGKITEACITAALNDSNPAIRKKAAFAKQMKGVRYQSGGGMNSGISQDWGYDPAQANVGNYYDAYNTANQQNDVPSAFGNLLDTTVNADQNKQIRYDTELNAPMSQYGGQYSDFLSHNPNFGTYGYYNPGFDSWLPINKMTGHNDYLPSPRHRIKGRQENLIMPEGSYLSKADLKYGVFNRSSPKNIHLEFNRPKYRQYNQEQIDAANPTHPTTQSYNTQTPIQVHDPAANDDFSKSFTPAGPLAEEYTPPALNMPPGFQNKLSGTPRGKYGMILKKAQYGDFIPNQSGPRAVPNSFDDPTFWTNDSANEFLGKARQTVGNMTQTAIEQPTNRLAQETAIGKANQAVGNEGPEVPAGTIDMNRRTSYNKEDLANWGLAGMEAATSLLNQGDVRRKEQALRNRTHADMVFTSQPQNAGSRGDYDTNSGMFRPDQDVPIQYQGQPGMRKMGGSGCYNCGGTYNHQVGGEVEMTDEEIQQYLDAGGELEYLD